MPHLSLATLSDYALGRLDEPEFGEASDHLDFCDECQDRLRDVDLSSDELAAALKAAAGEIPYNDEPEMKMALAGARQAWPSTRDNGIEQTARFDKPASALLLPSEYQVISQIGEGGMGTVYSARHTKLDRVVAVKVLRNDRVARGDLNARFMQEIKAIGKVDHPNIVRAYDAREVDGNHFLVMELLEGIDLAALSDVEGVLPVSDACEMIRQAAVGLQHAHELGLVHRDVKPSNFMLTQDGVVKLLDLGLSRLRAGGLSGADGARTADPQRDIDKNAPATGLTTSHHIVGTIDYMAPEQCIDGRNADARSDVYSLGATLFKLLMGRAPYSSRQFDTLGKKVAAIAGADETPMNINRRDLPEGLLAILRRMLAKNPSRRFSSAGEVAAALAPFAEGHEVRRYVHGPATAQSTATEESVDTTETRVQTIPPWGPGISKKWAVAGGMVPLLGLLAAFFMLDTPGGTLTVEVPPEGRDKVQVSVRNGDEVHIVNAEDNWAIELAEGAWQVQLNDPSDSFKLDRNVASITRGETEVVRVTLVPKESTASNNTNASSNSNATASSNSNADADTNGDAGADDRWQSFECSVYTKAYNIGEDGVIHLSGLKWKVMPRYVGIVEGGKVVDDRITVVLVDEANSFWPVIIKMSGEEARRMQEGVAAIIGEDKPESSDSVDCTLSTKGYNIDENGRITLAAQARLKFQKRYINVRPEGRFIEERTTILVEDGATGATPVAVRMPANVARSLVDDLGKLLEGQAGSEATRHEPVSVGTLKTREGFYVRAVKGGNDDVVADVREPKTSEQFTFEWLDGKFTRARIRTRDGYYFHAANGGGGDLDARRQEPGTSEIFDVEWLDDDYRRLRLKTREGYYVRAVRGGGEDVVANETEPGTSEIFDVAPVE